jgi:DNA-binding beta-propeller fold protein YncE/cytochrome c553
MDISHDGRLLACANRDSGTVTVLDLERFKKRSEITVGLHPEGLSFVGESHRLAVAVYGQDDVVFIDADEGMVTDRLPVFDEPYGVVSTVDGSRIYVTLDYPGQVLEIDPETPCVTREFKVSEFVRGIALTPDDRYALVTEFYTSTVKALELASGRIAQEWPGSSTDNLCRQIVCLSRRPKAYLPHIRSRVTAVHGEGSIFPYLAVIDTPSAETARRRRIPMDAFRGNLVTANPWEVAVSRDGRQLYVVFSGTNDLFACEILDDDYREIQYRGYLRTGHNPRAVRVAPDGKRFYVYNALDFEIVAYRSDRLEPAATIPVTENPLGEQVLRGKRLFYSALQPMVGRRWISCSSCHPDGDADGRTWHNPEGLRNTPAMSGVAWTHPLHWSADRDEVQDFEHTIRGDLMQGRGLIDGPAHPSLGTANRRRSRDLDALAAYNNSHRFAMSPHAKQGLSAAAQRGRELFFSEQTQCATCHCGPLFTDSIPRPAAEIVRHDVGTGDDDASEKMGPEYDTPTLLGIYRTAPYLHHGRAATLQEVLTRYNVGDRHGRTSHLDESQIGDLVAFLKSLPYEDPHQQARDAGLVEVVE